MIFEKNITHVIYIASPQSLTVYSVILPFYMNKTQDQPHIICKRDELALRKLNSRIQPTLQEIDIINRSPQGLYLNLIVLYLGCNISDKRNENDTRWTNPTELQKHPSKYTNAGVSKPKQMEQIKSKGY